MEQWRIEREQERVTNIETNNRNITHIHEAIRGEVSKLGLTISIVEHTKHGDPLEAGWRIAITHPTLEYFRIEILGKEWNERERARLFVDTDVSVTKPDGQYTDGSPRTISKRYEFDNYISRSDMEAIGIEKHDYSYRLSSLNVGFKATKNPKLIVKDVIPSVTKYLAAMTLIEPAIKRRMQADTDTLALQNIVSAKSKYKHTFNELKQREFDLDYHGRVTISECGNITLTKQISKEELLSMLGIK